MRLRWKIAIGVAAYGAAAYFVDVIYRRRVAAGTARAAADARGKPMLNVGAGTPCSAMLGATTYGDINLDLAAPRDAPCGPNVVCYGDAQDLSQYPDKHFGSLLASHVLEHVDDPQRALREWRRVADEVFIVVPSWWGFHTWLHAQHRWYIPADLSTAYPLWNRNRVRIALDQARLPAPARENS